MSVPGTLLEAEGRRDLTDFYGEVFGWQELPTETVDGQKLVMMAYTVDQFVFLIADDDPMTARPLDHFGMGVATLEELDEYLDRARTYQAKDDRVRLIDKRADVYPGVTLTGFYVGFLLPLMIEVQHFAFG
jgi:hypothetical protein